MAGVLATLRDNAIAVRDGLQNGSILRGVLTPRKDDIMSFQHQQLFEGKASNGEDMRPYYSEDLQPRGYFRSKASAEAYTQWKLTGIPYPYRANRNPDAPNLYINGKFHSELDVFFLPSAIAIGAKTMYADDIVAKYGIKSFGLSMVNWKAIFQEKGAYNDVMDEIKKKLYNG